MPILSLAIGRRADGPSIVGRPDPDRLVAVLRVRVGPAFYVHFGETLAGRVRLDSADVNAWLAPLPYWGLELVPGLTPEQCRIYKDEHRWHSHSDSPSRCSLCGSRSDSRSAEIATSSELL